MDSSEESSLSEIESDNHSDTDKVTIKTPASSADLSNMTLGEVKTLKEQMGLKAFHKKYGPKKGGVPGSIKRKPTRKGRPLEMSSKKPVHIRVSLPKRSVTRDPRFDDLSGDYNEHLFKRSYKFIDKLKKKEYKELAKIAVDEEMDEETRQKAGDLLNRLKEKRKAKKKASIEEKVNQTLKSERKEAIKAGQKPYFVKPALKKQLVLAEKYKQLKSKGQLDSYVKKKRKKISEKDKSHMPQLPTD